jgi:putative methyltransferase
MRVRPTPLPSSSPATLANPPSFTAIADSVLRCLPEDQSNGFFVACFVRAEPSPDADLPATSTKDEDTEATELTHAERQEAFKAKAKAKGGKGGPKGPPAPRPVKPVAVAKVEEKVEKAEKKKIAVPGKKAAYLAEKKRKQEEKEGGAQKKVKSS